MTTVGFVGLGAMGLPMATNLVRRQYRVQGFDLRREALDALTDAGGTGVSTAVEAARDADILVLMVVNAAQAEAVLFEAGAIDAMTPGGVIVLMATCAPAAVVALGERVTQAGCALVDAPVSGGVKGATTGTLTIMAAAPKPTFEKARPVLEALGDKLFHVGERLGQGAMVKTVNQLLCGVHIAVTGEAMAMAERAGIDGRVALEILGCPPDVPLRLRPGPGRPRRQPGRAGLPDAVGPQGVATRHLCQHPKQVPPHPVIPGRSGAAAEGKGIQEAGRAAAVRRVRHCSPRLLDPLPGASRRRG